MAGVTVSGVEETKRALNNFAKDVVDSQGLNKDIGSLITKQASALAPIKSGDLAKSIRYEAQNDKVVIYAGNERVEYAPIIEYGWQAGGREGKRFMGRAIDANMKTVVKKYEDEIQAGIKKYNLD
jgi:phage gpG-like protein